MDLQACTIGVDMGTTTVKAASFDDIGREVAGASQEVELEHPDSQAAEQSPHAVYAAVTQVLANVSQQSRERGYTATRIGLSSAMHSLMLVCEDNIPLTPAITWMDERAKDEADALWSTQQGKDLYARTGTPIHPMAPLAKLLWLRKHRSEVFQQSARFVSLKEWVWYQWFGEWQVDASIASATGLYNLHEQAWDGGALSLVHIYADRLSAIVPTIYSRVDAMIQISSRRASDRMPSSLLALRMGYWQTWARASSGRTQCR